MSKGDIVASYLVRVTLREYLEDAEAPEPLTIEQIETTIADAISDGWVGLEAHVSAERTDT